MGTIGAIVQARMSSSRLPGKVLHAISGKPMLQYLLESLNQCKSLHVTIVATSTDASDIPVEQFAARLGIPCFRGSLTDVASRFAQASEEYRLSAFVRLNGDSPLLDYRLVERAVSIYKAGSLDLVTNVMPRSFPPGASVEVVHSPTFRRVYPMLRESADKEHVTRYFYSHPANFTIENFFADHPYPGVHLAVDTPDHFQRVEHIIAQMKKPHWQYTLEETVALSRCPA